MTDSGINTILIDCDGVLTDGSLTIDHNGDKQFKRFHSKDVRSIRELIFNGFRVVIVTADDWNGISHFAEKVGAELIVERDKWQFAKLIGEGRYIAIGDDAWDVSMLSHAAASFVPADSDPCVKSISGVKTLETCGGRGVIAEVCRIIL